MAKQQTPTTGTCTRCRATLRRATSIARGMGAHCARQARKEAALQTAGYKPHQVASARELIEDGAILPLREGLFVVVSSDGSEFYEATTETCACKAAEAGRRCYHRAAATLLAA